MGNIKHFKIFIDENFPPQLAEGLNILQNPQNTKDNLEIEIVSIKKEFGSGVKDEDWIPLVGKQNGIVITQDYRIQTTRHQRNLYKEHGVGVLFFHPPSKTGFSYWEMVKQLVERWEKIKSIAKKHNAPFAFRCSARKDFEKIPD